MTADHDEVASELSFAGSDSLHPPGAACRDHRLGGDNPCHFDARATQISSHFLASRSRADHHGASSRSNPVQMNQAFDSAR